MRRRVHVFRPHDCTATPGGRVRGGMLRPANAPVKTSGGCVMENKALLKDIEKNPAEYYVNVHDADILAGTLRGQLSR